MQFYLTLASATDVSSAAHEEASELRPQEVSVNPDCVEKSSLGILGGVRIVPLPPPICRGKCWPIFSQDFRLFQFGV